MLYEFRHQNKGVDGPKTYPPPKKNKKKNKKEKGKKGKRHTLFIYLGNGNGMMIRL